MKVVIIIPTYNEKDSVGKVIEKTLSYTKSIKNHHFSILVVDANSPDGTATLIKSYMKKYSNVDLLLEKEKGGLGVAYSQGMKYAIKKMGADIIFEMDADGQHDPKYIPDFMKKFDEGYDYVLGSRYVKGGSIPKEWGLHRKIISYFGSMFARFFLGASNIKDFTGGYKASRVKGYLDRIDLDNLLSKRHAYKIHLLYEMLSLNAKTVEIPIDFKNRTEDNSKSTIEDLFESIKVVIVLKIRSLLKRS